MSQPPTPIKIAFADDHYIIREAFSSLLKINNRFELVGEAANGIELLDLVMRTKVDMVIIDIRMPLMDGIATTRKIKELHPDIIVLAMSSYHEPKDIVRALEAGAKGFLLKDCAKSELEMAIDSVLQNKLFLSPQINKNLLQIIQDSNFNPFENVKPINFSRIELNIIKLICCQYLIKEIAEELKMNIRTVERMKSEIQHKIGAINSVGICIYAFNNTLVEL
jgi:DNA-binding NarL/FixJ family response regulator